MSAPAEPPADRPDDLEDEDEAPAPDLERPRRRRPDHVSGADGISTR